MALSLVRWNDDPSSGEGGTDEAARAGESSGLLLYDALDVGDNLVEAIGLPREKLCTYCWTGESLYEIE